MAAPPPPGVWGAHEIGGGGIQGDTVGPGISFGVNCTLCTPPPPFVQAPPLSKPSTAFVQAKHRLCPSPLPGFFAPSILRCKMRF